MYFYWSHITRLIEIIYSAGNSCFVKFNTVVKYDINKILVTNICWNSFTQNFYYSKNH